jgi:hypothetical protein
VAQRVPQRTQQAELAALRPDGRRAWSRRSRRPGTVSCCSSGEGIDQESRSTPHRAAGRLEPTRSTGSIVTHDRRR